MVGYGFGSGKYLASGLDADGSVAACGALEFLDAPAGSVLDPVADRQSGEHRKADAKELNQARRPLLTTLSLLG